MENGDVKPQLSVSDLSLKFNDNTIFENINFTCQSGTLTLLKGKNGSGKTCLLNSICGVVQKHFNGIVQGSVVISSAITDIFSENKTVGVGFTPTRLEQVTTSLTPTLDAADMESSPTHLKRVTARVTPTTGEASDTNENFPYLFGFLMQEPDKQLCFPFIEEELFFGAENLKRDRSIVEKEYNNLLELFPFLKDSDSETFSLSFGQKKVLLFCAMILKDPFIFLLDEPNAGLSDDFRQSIRNLVLKLKARGNIIIVAEHENFYDDICDNVLELC